MSPTDRQQVDASRAMNPVFVTGGTGYIGRPLIEALLARRHTVHALARPASAGKLPVWRTGGDRRRARCINVRCGDSARRDIRSSHRNAASQSIQGGGIPAVDLASIHAAVTAARQAAVDHLVYISVAHPAPVMHAYIAVRQEGEALIRATKIRATILRPWYILGPGHRWPYALLPLYALLRGIPRTRDGAERLGLVTRRAMIATLVHAIETPPTESMECSVCQIFVVLPESPTDCDEGGE